MTEKIDAQHYYSEYIGRSIVDLSVLIPRSRYVK